MSSAMKNAARQRSVRMTPLVVAVLRRAMQLARDDSDAYVRTDHLQRSMDMLQCELRAPGLAVPALGPQLPPYPGSDQPNNNQGAGALLHP